MLRSGQQSPLVKEFNDSHLHDITLSHNEEFDVDSERGAKFNMQNLSPINKVSLDPHEAMRDQRDRVRE